MMIRDASQVVAHGRRKPTSRKAVADPMTGPLNRPFLDRLASDGARVIQTMFGVMFPIWTASSW